MLCVDSLIPAVLSRTIFVSSKASLSNSLSIFLKSINAIDPKIIGTMIKSDKSFRFGIFSDIFLTV